MNFFWNYLLIPRNSTKFRVQNSVNTGGKLHGIPEEIPEPLYFGDSEIWKHEEMETWRHEKGNMETWEHGDMDIKQETENGSPAIFLNPLPFAHRTNRSLSFVCLLTKKQREIIRLQAD